MNDSTPLEFSRFQNEITAHLDRVREAEKALKSALRLTREYFGAARACIAVLESDRTCAVPRFHHPAASDWDPELFRTFLAARRPKLPSSILIAPLERHGRRWALLVLEFPGAEFDRGRLRALQRVADTISKLINRLDRMSLVEVRARIDRKVMEQLRPKDLFYQILHGLRTLTGYDHSSALFIYDRSSATLDLVAEQIAWRKGKSTRIGTRLPVSDSVYALLSTGEVFGVERRHREWHVWNESGSHQLADLLDYGSERPPRAMLCAPLATRNGVLGVLRVASCYPESLGPYEAALVKRFLPLVAVAIENSRRNESLKLEVVKREQENAMSNLAHGVAHDINNALGAMLPLVQQLVADAREGKADAETLETDLTQVEASLHICRRIFGGMLTFAKGAGRNVGEGDLCRAVDTTLAILDDGMRRNGIRVHRDLGDALPMVRGAQSNLEQLILNLALNGREAMRSGGELSLVARFEDEHVVLTISDTGEGIHPNDLPRIEQPFFSTKRDGSGLGLSTCRSIVSRLRGEMRVQSELGKGTMVTVRLPVAAALAGAVAE